jgi:hypothetical protein
VAGPADLEGPGIDAAEHFEIDKTVVERRDQRVGQGMRKPHQIIIVTGGIDDDHAASACQRIDAGGFMFGSGTMDVAKTEMIENFKIASNLPGPGAPILDEVGETFLPGIEIDGGDALA